MKAVSIKPINIPKKGIGTKMIVGVDSYKLLNTNIKCFCRILSDTDKVLMKAKNIEIPIEIYNEWGDNDMALVEYIAQTQLVDIMDVIDITIDKKTDKKSDLIKVAERIKKQILRQQSLIIEKNRQVQKPIVDNIVAE